MTYKELKKHIKDEQKVLAEAIKKGKFARKPSNRTANNIGYHDSLFWNRINYRHKHIAYCEMFNRKKYSEIEQPRHNNKPNRRKIDGYKTEWMGLLDEEIIRNCA